jgi:uncharacterized protein (UPF0332 family)
LTPDQRDILEKARQSLAAAKHPLAGCYHDVAASRAYYVMFYAAQALLEGKGLSFSKHSAVIAAFGKHFASTGDVPRELHRWLIKAQELRHSADYGNVNEVTLEDAQSIITRGERFLETAERIIGKGS